LEIKIYAVLEAEYEYNANGKREDALLLKINEGKFNFWM